MRTLRDDGLSPVGILDLDLHYPNGTSVLVEEMDDATLHSLHASPVTNVAARHGAAARRAANAPSPSHAAPTLAPTWRRSRPRSRRSPPSAAALVVSLGYDTVAGDPHGSWQFAPEIFAEVGRLLAASRLPVCVIQEGGYSLPVAGRLQPRLRRRPAGGNAVTASRINGLEPFRRRLDAIDDEIARLLGERFEICREVALYKSAHEIPMMQPDRVADRAPALPRPRRRGRPARATSPPISSTC